MRIPKAPKAPKQSKPIKIGPIVIPKLVKPKLPPHKQAGMHGSAGHLGHGGPPRAIPLPAGALPPAPAGLPAPNTTADLYVSPNAPPAAPDQAGVLVHLEAEFEMATQHSLDPNFRWTNTKLADRQRVTEDVAAAMAISFA